MKGKPEIEKGRKSVVYLHRGLLWEKVTDLGFEMSEEECKDVADSIERHLEKFKR